MKQTRQVVPEPIRGTAQRIEGGGHYVLAVLAHAGIGLGFFGIGFLASLAISFTIWLVSKRSRYLYFHAEQAGLYQLLVTVVNIVGVIVLVAIGIYVLDPGTPAPTTIVDFLLRLWNTLIRLTPLLLLYAGWYIGTILLGMFGALMVALGRNFRYPWIGNYVAQKMQRSENHARQ